MFSFLVLHFVKNSIVRCKVPNEAIIEVPNESYNSSGSGDILLRRSSAGVGRILIELNAIYLCELWKIRRSHCAEVGVVFSFAMSIFRPDLGGVSVFRGIEFVDLV